MPTYNYKCTNEECDFHEDIFHGIKEDRPICPKCASELKQICKEMNFTLKGKGWARDGYK